MDVKQKLKDLAYKVDLEIENILLKELKTSKKISPIIEDFIETTSCIPLAGGKRIRAAFVYYSYLACKGKKLEDIIQIAACIELIHAYLLVHDDIQDRADLRRGEETIHKIYERIHKEDKGEENASHFGEAVAINSGDVLNHIGMNVLLNSNFMNKTKVAALNKLNRRIIDVGYGQTLDIYGEVLDNVDESYVLEVHKYKTGCYTYELPLHLGAIFAGANDEHLDAITNYAIPGGVAYQIQDDILGVFGNEETTGKSASSDITEGKKTLLTIKAFMGASKKDKIILNNTIGNPKASNEMIDAVKKIIVDTGSLDYSKNLAKKLLMKSSRALYKQSDWNQEGLQFLIGVNDYLLNREL